MLICETIRTPVDCRVVRNGALFVVFVVVVVAATSSRAFAVVAALCRFLSCAPLLVGKLFSAKRLTPPRKI